jgi:hypothetical protein
MLLVSYLPVIVWVELFSGTIAETLPYRMGALMALVLLGFTWPPAAPLRVYFMLIIAIYTAQEVLSPWLETAPFWQDLFTGQNAPAFMASLGMAFPRLLMVLLPGLLLYLMGASRRDIFLVRGRLDAPAEPARWLNIRPGQGWLKVGVQFLIAFTLVVLVVFFLVTRGMNVPLARMLGLLPLALLLAGLNAFVENFAFRAALLPLLLPAVGKRQGLLISAVFFSLPHFYGFPPGIAGLILTGFLGWVLAKAMVETEGFLWPWLIQLPLDILAVLALLLD